MNHWLALPIVLPLVTGAVLLLMDARGERSKRAVSLVATLILLALAIFLLREASSGEYHVYYLGNWPAPYGIVLVLDRLSALMLVLSALLAGASLLYAMGGDDILGRHFHALFHFQLLGINGAFLTGDLFNLFVFFEILLIASYCLLMHGGGASRTRAAMRFVVLNLVGSSVFLIALALVYGATGTLNIADLNVKVAGASADSRGLIHVGALLLLVVFGLKAAVVPLGFWLASAYRSAAAAVACLFAIMTKVGAYAIVRVHLLAFAELPGLTQSLLEPWLLPLALATVVIGTIGVLASHDLRETVAYLVVISMGTLLAAVGLLTRDGLSASIFYLMHSTLIAGGLFLLADLIARQRTDSGASLVNAQAVAQPALLGALFFAGAVAVAGLPPLSGFAAKVYILQAAGATPATEWVWGVLLVTGLLVIVSLSRAGSALFWRTEESRSDVGTARPGEIVSIGALLACPLLLVLGGSTIVAYTDATADQVLDRNAYVRTVLGNEGLVPTKPSEGVKP